MSYPLEIVLAEPIEALLRNHQLARIGMMQALKLRPIMRQTHPAFFLRMKGTGATAIVEGLLETRLNELDSKLFNELLTATALEIHLMGYQSHLSDVHDQLSSSRTSNHEMVYNYLIPIIGFRANEQDEIYRGERANTYVRFLNEFFNDFCYRSGHIDWEKLMAFITDNLKHPSSLRA